VAQHRGEGELVENVCVNPQAPQHRRHHDRPGALAAVSDLEGDRSTVGQPHGIDSLRAVLGNQAGNTLYQ